MMTIKTTLLAAGAALLLPLAASAAPGGGPGGFHHGAGHFSFLQGVTLTDAQKTQIHDLEKANRTAEKSSFQQLRALHKQISDALAQAGSINESQLAALQQQASQLRDQLEASHLQTSIKVRALLTPDQLAQSAQTHAQLASLHQQMHQVMGRGQTSQPAAAQ